MGIYLWRGGEGSYCYSRGAAVVQVHLTTMAVKERAEGGILEGRGIDCGRLINRRKVDLPEDRKERQRHDN